MKVTQWFDGNPVTRGVWEVQIEHVPEKNCGLFCYWDGRYWKWIKETPSEAFEERHKGTLAYVTKWRGLAEKPKS